MRSGGASLGAHSDMSASSPRSGTDRPDRVEIRGHLAVGVHGEVRVEVEQHLGAIRPACHDVIEICGVLYKQIAALDGPDALPVAKPKVPRVRRTRSVDRNGHDLAVNVVVEVNRPGIREEGDVLHRFETDGVNRPRQGRRSERDASARRARRGVPARPRRTALDLNEGGRRLAVKAMFDFKRVAVIPRAGDGAGAARTGR